MEVERRSLLKGLAAGLTGAVTGPTTAAAHATEPRVAAAQPANQAVAPAQPRLLDAHQRDTLASLADLILPGALAAGAIDRIDRTAALDTPAVQRRLLNAIARFDQEARGSGGGRWLDLSATARLEILTRAATAASGQPPTPAWTRGQQVAAPASVAAASTTLRDHLDVLKAAIGAAYASTEAGMTALGWAGRSAWRELPQCSHADPAHENPR
jgi:hypothetical protein